jgi:hypothetical protein
MPTVLRAQGFRLYFYSHEPNEPPHVHIDRGDSSAKFWIENVALARNVGFSARELGDIQRLVRQHGKSCWRRGMGSLAPAADLRVKAVSLDADRLSVELMDGRAISVPLAWYPRLANATPEQRARWELAGGGYGVHWPEIDEDLSTEGMLRGAPAAVGSLS